MRAARARMNGSDTTGGSLNLMALDRYPLGKLAEQKAPLATGAQQIERRAKHLVQIHCRRLGALAHAAQPGSISANLSRLMSLAYFFLIIFRLSRIAKKS